MTDYRTKQTLDVIVDGTVVFREELAGSSDYMQMGTDMHYAAKYARILNPDLPDGIAAEYRWSSIYGTVKLDGTIPALSPVHEYLIPQVLERFGSREWERPAYAAQ